MNELTATEKKEILPNAQNFLKHTKQYMKEIGDTFFLVGCHLYEAQKYNYVEALGYESIEQLAEAELDLGKSSTYNLINVFKRFCDRDEYRNYKTWIAPQYRKYKYSQLVEMEKAYCLSNNIEKEIPPETPVRVIKEYIKYLNKNPGRHKTLPEWKNEQEQFQIVENTKSKLDDGKLTTKDFDLLHSIIEKSKKTQEETVPEPTVPVQTFAQPTCADKNEKPKSNVFYLHNLSREELANIIDNTCKIFDQRIHTYTHDGLWLKTPASFFADELYPKIAEHILKQGMFQDPMNNPPDVFDSNKYSLQSRQGVRDFLADYKSWHRAFGFNNFYFDKIYSCTLKDQTYIYACERKIYVGTLQLGQAETKVTYFFNAFKGDGVSEISQTQFEQYCTEHKDEL